VILLYFTPSSKASCCPLCVHLYGVGLLRHDAPGMRGPLVCFHFTEHAMFPEEKKNTRSMTGPASWLCADRNVGASARNYPRLSGPNRDDPGLDRLYCMYSTSAGRVQAELIVWNKPRAMTSMGLCQSTWLCRLSESGSDVCQTNVVGRTLRGVWTTCME
jgi:hypothetical protein